VPATARNRSKGAARCGRLAAMLLASVSSFAAAVALPPGGAVAAQRVSTRDVRASGGVVRFRAVVRNARRCTWTSKPPLVGFDATVHCHSGLVARAARISANPSTASRTVVVALAVHGVRPTAHRWQVEQSGTPPRAGSTAPAVAPARGGPVSGGDSKTPCIYAGSADWLARLASADLATGLTFGCVEAFATGVASWSDWADPWVIHPSAGYGRWLAADPGGRTVVLTVDLAPTGEITTDPSWRSVCAQGAFAGYATQLAENLVAAGFGGSVIRLGAEMNGTWVTDFIGTTSADQRSWAQCFAATVSTMRAVPGAHFLFDWNVAACGEAAPLASYYPGNAAVDIVGVDAYDAGCPSAPPPASTATFASIAANPEGLDAVAAFAATNGKPMSIPEWATTASNGAPAGYGDDPFYVAGVGRFVAASPDFAFQSWYDAGDKGVLQLGPANPQSLAAYVQAFG